MRRYILVSLAAVAAATACVGYLLEWDERSILFAVGITLSLAWNILHTLETRIVEERIRKRDITFREFDNIAAAPLRNMLRRLMDLGDGLAGLFEIADQQDKIKQTEKMNNDIYQRLYALESECMRVDAMESDDFGGGWADVASGARNGVLDGFKKALQAADEDEFIEGISDVQAALSDLNASIQQKIYERFRAIG